ncbi:MAG TPA: DsbA family protein, partial [Myxococcaceae bacterium]|nr:DsbA family protein [Myxococcaceae bacterium]
WCYVASVRLALLRREFGEAVRWTFRPFPLRIAEGVPSPKEVSRWVKEIERARLESEGIRLRADLWTGGDPPRSSIPALVALEAARLQGASARQALAKAMQRAALEEGVNVCRSDVALELASSVGLEMNRFVAAYQSTQTRQLVLEEYRVAGERGVNGVPTLVIGERWMISGLRDLSEYRRHILSCMGKLGMSTRGSPETLLH